MSAVRDFPRHTNLAALSAGLVLQTQTEIDTNEYGLAQATLKFLCLNQNRKRCTPVRGTGCDQFRAGDDVTKRALKDMAELGAQTSRFIRHGKSPGKGILEVLCQGAIFDSAYENGEITKPDIVFDYTPRTLQVVIYGAAGGLAGLIADSGAYYPIAEATLEYFAIDISYEYVTQSEPFGPRFFEADPGPPAAPDPAAIWDVPFYGWDTAFQPIAGWQVPIIDPITKKATPATGLRPPINHIEGQSRSASFDLFAASGGSGTVSDTAIIPKPLPFRILGDGETNIDPKIDYRPWIKMHMEPGRFHIVQAGRYWHVQEVNTLAFFNPAPKSQAQLAVASGG